LAFRVPSAEPHADWPGLVEALRATGAERVVPTHGSTRAMVRWLGEQGLAAEALDTRFSGEQDDSTEAGETAEAGDAAEAEQ